MSVIIVQPVFVKKCTKQGKFFMRVRLYEEGGKDGGLIYAVEFFCGAYQARKVCFITTGSSSLLFYFSL